MKILTGIDIPFNPFGGSPIICDDWYSAMEKEHEILFLAMPPTINQKWWKMSNVHFLNTKKTRDPQKYPAYIQSLSEELEKIIKSFEPDIIHLQHLNFGLSRAFAEIKSGTPKIGICHGTDTQAAQKHKFFKTNLIKIVDNVDHLVFPTKNMMIDFFKVYKKEKPFSIFPHGIPDEFFKPHLIHKQEKTLRLLYAGRLNTYKGADIAIKSLLYTNIDATLDVIGDEDEAGFMDKIREIVDDNLLENIVTFYPQISREKLIQKYSGYDAIIIPSRYLEAFSLTSIEAQSRGLPVIYGNGGGISDVIGDSGYLIEDNKPKTLAKIIDEINVKRDLLEQLRQKGYINAEKFKLNNQIHSLLKLSTKLINKVAIMSANPQKQAITRFLKLWETESPKLKSGKIIPAKMKDGATDPIDFCISTIARLSLQPSGKEKIANIRHALSKLFSAADDQFIYPDESLHISLVGCTKREASPDVFHKDQIEKIEHICKSTTKEHTPTDILLKGIGIIGNQIFIQGIPFDRGWEETRADITSKLEQSGEAPISYPDKSPIHINIIRITNLSDDKLKLLHTIIEQLREIDLGIIRVATIELVITDFVVSKNNLTTISEIKLNKKHEEK